MPQSSQPVNVRMREIPETGLRRDIGAELGIEALAVRMREIPETGLRHRQAGVAIASRPVAVRMREIPETGLRLFRLAVVDQTAQLEGSE